MSRFTSTRHLFLPCIDFEVLLYPNGATEPTPIEKAAMLLIGSYWENREKLEIDLLIDILSLGEPGGRELINGLWRKGWVVIGGADATLYPSVRIQAHLKEKGTAADFADMGTAERPERFTLFFDLILGQTFVAQPNKISYSGARPYMIEPFYPDSIEAPYGTGISGFLDLTKQEMLSSLQYDVRFRKWRAPREAMELIVVPPPRSLSHKDIKFVRLFFDIGRDIRQDHDQHSFHDFVMRGAETSNETLKRLADGLSDVIVDKILSQETPLRQKFLDEVRQIQISRRSRLRRTRSQIGMARQRFQEVEDAPDREVTSIFAEAREMTERAIREISETLERTRMRQADVRFVEGRAQVDRICAQMLGSFTDQAVLISQHSAAGKIVQIAESVASDGPRERRLLIQTGGSFNRQKIITLTREVDRTRSLRAGKSARDRRDNIRTQYVDKFDQFVDAAVLIADGAEVLLASESLLVAGNAPQSAFHVRLLTQPVERRRARQVSANAANELLARVLPTFVSPSPRLDVRPRHMAPPRDASQIEARLDTLVRQLGEEAAALEREGTEALANERDTRNLARMIAGELEQIEKLLEVYEQDSPMTAEGVQDEEILNEVAAMIARTEPDKPLIIGVHPNQHIDMVFRESIEDAVEKRKGSGVELRLIFLSQPDEAWRSFRNKLLTNHTGGIKIDDPDTLTEAVLTHRRGFSNFLISGLGSIVASGGFSQRILLGPKRRDKKHLGLVFRGKGAQDAATAMLGAVLRVGFQDEPVPDPGVYATQPDLDAFENFLASHLFHRWLVEVTKKTALEHGHQRVNNFGIAALRPAFEKQPGLFERCLQSAEKIGDTTFGYAARKAAQLAGILSRDGLAQYLWSVGRVFEAVHVCQTPPPDHPLADLDLRAYVASVYLGRAAVRPDTVCAPWLENEDLLALIALDLFDPNRRFALSALDSCVFPATPLGRLVKAIHGHVRHAPTARIVLTPSQQERPPHPPLAYCNDLETTLKLFERDRGNTEAHNVQGLVRERYGPISEMWRWLQARQGQIFQTDGDVAAAADQVRTVLKSAFGDRFEAQLASRGNRERIAAATVTELDRLNRQQNPTHRELVGPKKQGLVINVARSLELLLTLHLAARPATEKADNPHSRAVQESVGPWLTTWQGGPMPTPRSVLAGILANQGRSAPDGHVDFGLWRFPRFLEDAVRGKPPNALARSLLQEEWPPETDVAIVFRQLVTNNRMVAADLVLRSRQDMLSVGENETEFARLQEWEERLQLHLDRQTQHVLDRARQLELEAARVGDLEIRQKACEVRDLHEGLSLAPREIEDGNAELNEVQRSLRKVTDDNWQRIVESAASRGPFWRECASAVDRQPVSRRRSIMLALPDYAPCAAPLIVSPGRAVIARTRIRNLVGMPGMTVGRAANTLRFRKDDDRGLALLRAAPAILEGRKYIDSTEAAAFLQALDATFGAPGVLSEKVLLEPVSDESLCAVVHLPEGGLRDWLDWQFPKHVVVVLLGELSGEVTLHSIGFDDDRLPVIINPFLLPPQIEDRHVLIDLGEVVSAYAEPNTGETIRTMVAARAGPEIILPWTDRDDASREADLARFLGCSQHDLVQRPGSSEAAALLSRLLARLRIEPRWMQRGLFDSADHAAQTAAHCLGYCSAGHLSEVYGAILHARNAQKELRSTIHVDHVLDPSGMNDRLLNQGLRMMHRWHRLRGLTAPTLRKQDMQRLLCQIWLRSPDDPKGYDRAGLGDFVGAALGNAGQVRHGMAELSPAARQSLARWLIDDGLMMPFQDENEDRFVPDPTHVLTTIDF